MSDAGERWTVRIDVGDLGGHTDTSLRGWATTLAARVIAAAKDAKAVSVLPGVLSETGNCSN